MVEMLSTVMQLFKGSYFSVPLLVQDLYDPTQLSRTAQRTWIMFHPLQSEV